MPWGGSFSAQWPRGQADKLQRPSKGQLVELIADWTTVRVCGSSRRGTR